MNYNELKKMYSDNKQECYQNDENQEKTFKTREMTQNNLYGDETYRTYRGTKTQLLRLSWKERERAKRSRKTK